MTSGAGCCDSVEMLGFEHSFFALVSTLSLRLFRVVEVSISSDCSILFFFAYFLVFFFKVMTLVELQIRLVLIRLILLMLSFCCVYCFCCWCYCCFFPFLITWVHPFSGFGWFRGRISGWADVRER